jgi:glycosyltransferase involved in cell wall biosynthesis
VAKKYTKMQVCTKLMRESTMVLCITKQLARIACSYLGQSNNVFWMPGGLWGTEHTRWGINPHRFFNKIDYNVKNELNVIMNISLTIERKWKGLPLFLRTMRGIENVKFHCYGKINNLESKVRNMIFQDMNSKLHFFGYTKDWPKRLNTADIFVHPSLFDGFPRCVAEAMCSGLPILSYNIHGISVVSPKKNILLCDPMNKNSVMNNFHKLKTDENFRRELGTRARDEAMELTEKHRGDFARLMLNALKM